MPVVTPPPMFQHVPLPVATRPVVTSPAANPSSVSTPRDAAPSSSAPSTAATHVHLPDSRSNRSGRNGSTRAAAGVQPGFSKKQVYIVGDSMLNNIDEKLMRAHNFVRVRNHPGATTEDLLHHMRPHIRKTLDSVILLAGHNDITENRKDSAMGGRKDNLINSAESMRSVIREIRQSHPDCQIAICQLTVRNDRAGIMKDVNRINREYAQLAQREQVDLVKMDKFTDQHLGQGGIHPTDRKGKPALAGILTDYVAKL